MEYQKPNGNEGNEMWNPNQNLNRTASDGEIEIDLMQILFELKKRLWLIIAVAVLGAGIAGVFSKVMLTPQYTSTSMLYVLSKETTLTTLADLQIGTQLTKDYRVMITSRPVMEDVIETLGLNMGYKTLRSRLSISNPADTRILSISIQDADPQMAKAIVDEVAKQASEYIAEIMEMAPPKLVEDGDIPTVRTSPSIRKNAMMGGLLGGFLVCGLIALMVILNDTIQSEEDVEKYLGLSVLAMVPDREGSSSSRKKKKRKKNKKESNPYFAKREEMEGKEETDSTSNYKQGNTKTEKEERR